MLLSAASTHLVVVGRLVLREADVAIDPEWRPSWIRLERDPPCLEPLAQRDAQRLEWPLQEPFVVGLPWVEPRAVVVVGEVHQELDGLGREPGEGVGLDRGCCRHGGPSLKARSRHRTTGGFIDRYRASVSRRTPPIRQFGRALRSTVLAQLAISARRDAPSLARMCSTWLLAVFGAIPSESAISAFV